LPQLPQSSGLVFRSEQWAELPTPQSVSSAAHLPRHVPATQKCSASQATKQLPQLSLSLAVEAQYAPSDVTHIF
jgi:hypothetical protein